MSNMDFPAFAVARGEEGSDPLVMRVGRVVRVDQYRASGHLERLDADLADVGGLGVKVWRYGMPWRLTESEPGVYDWTLWDRALEHAPGALPSSMASLGGTRPGGTRRSAEVVEPSASRTPPATAARFLSTSSPARPGGPHVSTVPSTVRCGTGVYALARPEYHEP